MPLEFLLILLGISGLLKNSPAVSTVATTTVATEKAVRIGDATITAEIADTPTLREQGLSDRLWLAPDHGMLFIFDQPGLYSFWMKNMHFPIDIIWLDQNKKVISINKNIATTTFPTTFTPPTPAQYVLEINAGKGNTYNIKTGDTAIIK